MSINRENNENKHCKYNLLITDQARNELKRQFLLRVLIEKIIKYLGLTPYMMPSRHHAPSPETPLTSRVLS